MKKALALLICFVISVCCSFAYTLKGHAYFEYFEPLNIDTYYPYVKEDNYLEISFYLPDTTILLYHTVVLVKDDLTYHTEIEKFAAGRYDVVVDGDRWLRKRYRNVHLSARYSDFDFYLTPGDINNDNIINPVDWWFIFEHLYTYHTHPNYHQKANLTGDNLINVQDLSICASNQGMIGDI